MVRELAERAYFVLCLAPAWLLRSGKYSHAHIVDAHLVRKHRLFYAPLLIWMGGPLLRVLDAGVRVLPQHDWEARERRIYRSLYDRDIQVDADGTPLLPRLPGVTLAELLDDPAFDEPARVKAIERAVAALAAFHRRGFTHGDAMAENVMIDLDAGIARWFDFETIHETSRAIVWRRADDLRALLTTCLQRTAAAKIDDTLQHIVAAYADDDVTRQLRACFASPLQRPLIFHLAQARLSFRRFGQIDQWLRKSLER